MRVGKTRNFQPISRRISVTVQDRTKVTIKIKDKNKAGHKIQTKEEHPVDYPIPSFTSFVINYNKTHKSQLKYEKLKLKT